MVKAKKRNIIVLSFSFVLIILVLVLWQTTPSLARFQTIMDNDGTTQAAKFIIKINGNSVNPMKIDLQDTIDQSNKYSISDIVPGTNGVIPIEVDATESEVALRYEISITSSSLEFPINLKFYTDENKTIPLTLDTVFSGSFLSNETDKINNHNIYWEWEYKTDETSNENDNLWVNKDISIEFEIISIQTIEGDVS